MQWTDANLAQWTADRASGRVYPEPERGVCFASDCGRFRVAAAALNVPAEDRTWIVWDMTGVSPVPMMSGFHSHTVAMRAAEAMGESRGFRVALRLAAIGRAVWAGLRRLTA
jgi:hypothetical protein